MTARSMGRARGVVIECNRCGTTIQTANIVRSVNRDYAAKHGWGRGTCPAVRALDEKRHAKTGAVTQEARDGSLPTKTHDFCPKCHPLDRAAGDVIRAEKAARKAKKADRARKRAEALSKAVQ